MLGRGKWESTCISCWQSQTMAAVPQGLRQEYLLRNASQWAAGGEPAPPQSYALSVSRVPCFSQSSLSELLCIIFNSISMSCCYRAANHQCCWLSQLRAAVRLFWCQLVLALSNTWAGPAVFSQKPLLKSPCCQHLAVKTQYRSTLSGFSHWNHQMPKSYFRKVLKNYQ